MTVNWFPGHMARALREIKERLSQVDLVIETCDARIPLASRNPALAEILRNKPVILVLNKSDLADPAITRLWKQYYSQTGQNAIACDSIRRTGLKQVVELASQLCLEKQEKAKAKGRLIRPIRAMVVGIPNTGKSSLINALSSRKAAKTADKPGVTRQLSWIRSGGQLELMDSPGVLWPRISSRQQQLHLAATGAIRDELLSREEIAAATFAQLLRQYPQLLQQRYRLDGDLSEQPLDTLLAAAARSHGCLASGGTPDLARFSTVFLDAFRDGRIGRISLECPGAPGQEADQEGEQ